MPTNSTPINFPFLHSRHQKEFLLIYLIIILLAAYFSWQLFSTFEAFILTTSNRLAAIIYDQPFPNVDSSDQSSLEITTSPHLHVLVTLPNGQKVGDTQDDVRFNQYPSTIKETVVFKETRDSAASAQPIWQLLVPTPPIGSYKLVFSSKTPGTYPLTIIATSRNGLYSKTFSRLITINPNTPFSYHFKFHKDVVHQAQLKHRLSLKQLLASLTQP